MKRITLAFLFCVAGSVAPLTASPITFKFTVDTSLISGQADFLDFQLEAGNISSLPVTVQISGFAMNGGSYVPGDIQLNPDASGTLPDSLLIDNGSNFNDAFQPATLGSSLSFFATFSGPGVDTPSATGSTFGFSIYDSSGINPLLTTSGDGSIAGVTVSAANGAAPYTNPPTPGGVSVAAISVVPEPGSITLLGLGLAGFGALLRRRK